MLQCPRFLRGQQLLEQEDKIGNQGECKTTKQIQYRPGMPFVPNQSAKDQEN